MSRRSRNRPARQRDEGRRRVEGRRTRKSGRQDEARPPSKTRPPIDRLLLVVVLAAALLRIWGITDRLPDPTLGINILEDTAVEETDRTTMGRSWAMWRAGTKPVDLNPHTGGWPALSFYATLGIQYAYSGYYGVTHPGSDRASFVRAIAGGSAGREIFLLARIVGALLGVVTVWLAYLLGTHVGGRTIGFGTALLLALNLQHILVSQHVSDPNLLALLFVELACFPMLRIAEGRGSWRDSVVAGGWIGLAGACKYVPLVLGLPFLLAHPRGLRSRAFWLGASAILAALFLATPFTFLDWKTTLRDLTAQRNSLFSSWVGQSYFPISLPTYLIRTIPHAMGWPAYLLALPGCVLLWKRGRAGRVLVVIAAVLILVNGMLKAAQERYLLVALPILFLAAAIAFERAHRWWSLRAPSIARRTRASSAAALPLLVAALTVGWTIPELAEIRSTLRRPDTRHAARRWIVANIPRGAPIAVDLYGPVFPEGERLHVVWPFFATQAPLVRVAYHPDFLDGLRFVAASSGVSGRFASDSVNYPTEVAYYRWLSDHARLLWSTREVEASGPVVEIRELPPRISTRARRDSLFEALQPRPTRTIRLALWCFDLARRFNEAGMPDRGEEWSLRGIRVGSRLNAQLYGTLAVARLDLRNPAGAEEAARKAIALAPGKSPGHIYRGSALHELGRHEEALAEFRKAFALSGDVRIRVTLGEQLGSLGRYAEAARELEAVPEGNPERAAARRDLAILYLQYLNRREEGIAALREAAALEPNPRQAAALRAELARLTGGERPAR